MYCPFTPFPSQMSAYHYSFWVGWSVSESGLNNAVFTDNDITPGDVFIYTGGLH